MGPKRSFRAARGALAHPAAGKSTRILVSYDSYMGYGIVVRESDEALEQAKAGSAALTISLSWEVSHGHLSLLAVNSVPQCLRLEGAQALGDQWRTCCPKQ